MFIYCLFTSLISYYIWSSNYFLIDYLIFCVYNYLAWDTLPSLCCIDDLSLDYISIDFCWSYLFVFSSFIISFCFNCIKLFCFLSYSFSVFSLNKSVEVVCWFRDSICNYWTLRAKFWISCFSFTFYDYISDLIFNMFCRSAESLLNFSYRSLLPLISMSFSLNFALDWLDRDN